MFGPVTTAERTGWQRRAVRVLAALLEHAQTAGYPPVHWTINTTGGLTCRPLDTRVVERRAAFEIWRAYLDAEPWPEHTRSGGIVHLHAVARTVHGERVAVAVVADLIPDEDDDESDDIGGGEA
jgi:hypothetical protein